MIFAQNTPAEVYECLFSVVKDGKLDTLTETWEPPVGMGLVIIASEVEAAFNGERPSIRN